MRNGTANFPQPAVVVLGPTSWDQFLVLDQRLKEGGRATITARFEAGGGTAANIAVALTRLGVPTLLVTTVGDDALGQQLRSELQHEGVEVHLVPPSAGVMTDCRTILVTPGPERTILECPGARLRLGDPLPLDRIFAASLVVIATDDAELHQFLVDLPAHIAPRVRLVGTLTHLAELPPERSLHLALQHDVLVGNEREFQAIFNLDELDTALDQLRATMALGVTRLVAMRRGHTGCLLVTTREIVQVPPFEITVVDSTGAEDAFAAGVVFGQLLRMPLQAIGRFANALEALSTRAMGARTALPTRDEISVFLREARPCP